MEKKTLGGEDGNIFLRPEINFFSSGYWLM